jgi:hypothetical protein
MAQVPSQERLVKDVRRVLEHPFWIPELVNNEVYSRLHDDHDGEFTGRVSVVFSPDSDAWIFIDKIDGLRFRTYSGGGASLRVRNALIILALAIKLDNEEHPIVTPEKIPEP